ncbi:MAG TPA: PKD domain-containing protein, partial [Patescibacteria group bacterium]|nr:PKD domain-containing protein [Patescibacteria group bacterium]
MYEEIRVLIGSVAAFAVLAIAGLLYIPHADAGQCLSSSVMKCGFTSATDMRNKYNNDDTPGTKNIYTYFGISSDIVNHYTTKDGTVTKNGDVYIGSEKVATGAMTADRIDIAGSNRATKRTYNGTTFYTRTTEIAPSRAASAKVIVFLNSNGEFAGAVVYDCGNPIKGHPVPKPKPPVYACNSLKNVKASRTTFTFTTTASASNGATIKDYSYNFGDGSTKTAGASTSHTYTKPGTYTVTVNVNVTVNGKTVVAPGSCKTSVTVTPEMCT